MSSESIKIFLTKTFAPNLFVTTHNYSNLRQGQRKSSSDFCTVSKESKYSKFSITKMMGS